jgi:hypothetical protein
MRLTVAGVAAFLLAGSPAVAGSAEVEAAIKLFNAVAADPVRLKIFCDMDDILEAAGDKDDPKIDAEIDAYIDRLGDFATAWEAGEDLDENSPEGKAFNAAVEALEAKCT